MSYISLITIFMPVLSLWLKCVIKKSYREWKAKKQVGFMKMEEVLKANDDFNFAQRYAEIIFP